MRYSKIRKAYIRQVVKSLENTPCEAKTLIKILEDISGVKSKCSH